MAGEKKPKSHAINNSKKGKQRFLPNNRAVRKKGAYPLRPGVQGFFITCDGGRERQAAQEAINVIDTFFEELIHGKGTNPTGLVDKPLGKKIKFSYSDDEGDDNDEVKEEEEDSHEEEEELKEEEEELKEEEEDNHEEELKEEEVKKEEVKDEEEKKVKDEEEEKVKDEEEEKVKDEEEEKVEDENKSDILQSDNDKNEKSGSCLENSCGENQTEKKTDDSEEGSIDVKKENEAEEPPAKKQRLELSGSECVAPAKAEEKSIDKLIEEELKELGDKNKRRFFSLDSGCNGVAFIQMRKIDGEPCPKDIVQHMMTSAASTRKHMSRFILRVLPVEVACYSSEEEISRAIAPVVEKYFPADAKDPHKFAVQYGARANTGIDRMKIINAVAKSVPEPHKVDLSNPDKTIIVEIAKTVCLIGVVEKYKELSKYNLRQLTSPKQ